ncbi:N-acetylmuramoyl-L-alanine amidase [Treponema sp.]|uniref:N-acetylmuramoyl-L-alanine amidase n=1 Tax=Treponema sp. TaxID=166 RepID=UPI00388F4409
MLIFFSCASSDFSSVSDSDFPETVRLAPDVNAEMLCADYWIQKAINPRKVKMSLKEIALWNRMNESVRYPKESDFAIVSDLRKFDSVMTALEIRSSIQRYPSNSVWYKKVSSKNGEEIKVISQKNWRAIFEEMNHSGLETLNYFMGGKPKNEELAKKDYPVKKAVCVRRSNLRLVPDDTFYSDDKEYWYDDIAQNSGILMNEPVLVLWESKSKEWLFVKSSYCTGWIHSADIAFCSDEEFMRRFDFASKNQKDFVTITDDCFNLPAGNILIEENSGFENGVSVFMGTYLFTSDWNNLNSEKKFHNRTPYANYLIELPYRKSDGTLGKSYACLPVSCCTQGLLSYTTENTLNLAFKTLGKHYGWGGMTESRDCSEYLMSIFRCFGFNFARNSRSQLAMSGKTVSFEQKTVSKKNSLLSSVEPGTLMGFPGHVFMYLGKSGENHYVISALGSYYFNELKVDANSVSINTLEMKRKTGQSWLELLSKAKLLYNDSSFYDNRVFFNQKWQFAEFSKINSGFSYLYKSDVKNPKNIVVAVNAGHGTKGGTKIKTYSHPDKSPKVTGGTNAKGAVESIAVSGGMVFNDGKTESEVNLRTARLFKDLLLKEGYDVLMIRDCDDVQLDNIARTVIANNNASIHIALHYDSDSQKTDKGCFYCSIPEEIKNLSGVKKHWKKSEKLGKCLIRALENNGLNIYNGGSIEVDLTQTSFSTIPTVDIELGNQCTDTDTNELEKRAKALLEGIELFFK